MRRFLAFLPFLALCSTAVLAESADDFISVALVEPATPQTLQDGIVRVPLGEVSGEQCFTVLDKKWVHELGDGSVYFTFIDRTFGELNIVFGNDQRDVARIVNGTTSWQFCFELFVIYDEIGNMDANPRGKRFIPPDMSS